MKALFKGATLRKRRKIKSYQEREAKESNDQKWHERNHESCKSNYASSEVVDGENIMME